MRSKEEVLWNNVDLPIMVNNFSANVLRLSAQLSLLLEVLLDIRELLKEANANKATSS
jgi:hypothetical protein